MLSEQERKRNAAYEKAHRDFREASKRRYKERITYKNSSAPEARVLEMLSSSNYKEACKEYEKARNEFHAAKFAAENKDTAGSLTGFGSPTLDALVDKYRIKDPVENMPKQMQDVVAMFEKKEKLKALGLTEKQIDDILFPKAQVPNYLDYSDIPTPKLPSDLQTPPTSENLLKTPVVEEDLYSEMPLDEEFENQNLKGNEE